MHDWRSAKLTSDYLEGVRGGIPLAATQIEVIIRIIRSWMPEPRTILDLGCGDGILGRQILNEWPQAYGIFMDFSDPMIASVQEKCRPYQDRCAIIKQDYGEEKWTEAITDKTPLDVVISGYSIHHQEDVRKYRIYKDVFRILKPGGIFLNLEHVASQSKKIEALFDETFIDGLYAYHKETGGKDSRAQIAGRYYNREDKVLNKLSPVEVQVEWLRKIGYENTDCFFKLFELALFGGQKPE